MKDTVILAGDFLLTYFGATGESKRLASVSLTSGYSIQLTSDRVGISYFNQSAGCGSSSSRGAADVVLETFGTPELAVTALDLVRRKALRKVWKDRFARLGRRAFWCAVVGVAFVFVLSMNTIATSFLLQGGQAHAVSTPAANGAIETLPVTAAAANTKAPDAEQLRVALEGGVAAGSYAVPLSEGELGSLYVFSDPSCSYCRRLERAIEPLAGQVKIAAFPVTVVGGAKSAAALSGLFCLAGSDRLEQWASAIRGKAGGSAECSADAGAIAANNEFFNAMGFEGTPTIINGKGEIFPSTRPATTENLLAWALGE